MEKSIRGEKAEHADQNHLPIQFVNKKRSQLTKLDKELTTVNLAGLGLTG